MTTVSRLRIGVHAGRLAASLADEVTAGLHQTHPALEIECVKVGQPGDHALDRSRPSGGFAQELDEALREGRIDAALHDLQDLPAVRPDAFVLAAVPRRRHPFDVLFTRDGRILDELDEGERVAASSASRRSQILAYREDIRVATVRGTVESQWRQLQDGAFEALVLAMIDAERLGMQGEVSEIFTTEVCVPYPGQGALALETLAERRDALATLRVLDDPASHAAVVAARAWLAELGDDLDLPAGALANVVDKHLVMEAVVLSLDGLEVVRDEVEGPVASAEALGAKLAARMMANGAEDVLGALRDDGEP
jgi:hydroxymethylbilane synthase